jgi:hypothetical protein
VRGTLTATGIGARCVCRAFCVRMKSSSEDWRGCCPETPTQTASRWKRMRRGRVRDPGRRSRVRSLGSSERPIAWLSYSCTGRFTGRGAGTGFALFWSKPGGTS